MSVRIPLSAPDIGEREIAAVTAVMRGPQLSLGPKLREFEGRIASIAGQSHAIAVSSGTAGLHLALLALGVGVGDEVIVPSFTFIAAANSIRYTGATPVFVDIDRNDLNMDPSCVEEAITPRTKAILAVHTFGVPARMDALCAIARRHNLRLIEDACEAIGATMGRKPVGSFGDAAVFGFYPNKQITTGEGGTIVTPHEEVAKTCRALRNQGRFEGDSWHQHSLLGYNYRLSEINCALGCVQAERLEEVLAARAGVAGLYQERLGKCKAVTLPTLGSPELTVSWFVYVVRIPAVDRDRIARELAGKGIQTGRYFAPIHTQPAYAAAPPRWPLPVTAEESRRTLALPFFNSLKEEEIAEICEALTAALGR